MGARRKSGDGMIVYNAPREARPWGRLRHEPRRDPRTRQHRSVPACSSLSGRYLGPIRDYVGPPGVDIESERTPPRWGEAGHVADAVGRAEHHDAGAGPGDDG